MSTNCISCIKNKRTGHDLLCDDCRKIDVLNRAALTVIDMCREYIHGGIDATTFANNLGIYAAEYQKALDAK